MQQLADAWQDIRNGRPRPVGVEIPVDKWLAETSYKPDSLAIAKNISQPISDDAIQSVADLITAAKYPLIAVGSGAQSHSDNIRTLANTIGAGVMAFRTGHGIVDSRNPLSISMPVGHRLWQECDLVIGLGTRLITQKKDWGVDENITQRSAPAASSSCMDATYHSHKSRL